MSTLEQKKAARGNDNEPDEGTYYIQAEQKVLGAILKNPKNLDRVSRQVEPKHFCHPLHGALFDVMRRLADQGRTIDYITVSPFFDQEERIYGLSMVQYLGRLMVKAAEDLPRAIDDHVRVISDFSGRININEIGVRAQQHAGDPNISIFEAAADVRQELDRIAGENRPDSYGLLNRTIDGVMKAIRERRASGGGISGLSTGYPRLDEWPSGRDGDGGRPAEFPGSPQPEGRTAFRLYPQPFVPKSRCTLGARAA
jgi:replicative DNA helicase